ncbi:Heat stress transcription factor C-1b [Hordeum vulgare]|nr:Heat stress transcription factor C-1b [Hordeum vulgare]
MHLSPLCVICKKEGHASSYYPTRGKHLHLQIMGSAIPGEGFFCREFEDDEEDVGSDMNAFNGAILSTESGKLSLRTLKQELKHMVAREWGWKISHVGDDDFSVVFPSTDLLHMAKSSGKLFLSVNDITVKVRDTIHEEITPLSMPEVWLRLYGIPKKHRRVARLMDGL